MWRQQVKGGTLSFSNDPQGDRTNVSMEIKKSKTKASCSYDGGQLTVRVKIRVDTNLVESAPGTDLSRREEQRRLEERAAEVMTERIMQVIRKAQMEFGVDAFGFGNMIYKDTPDLWRQIHREWDGIFSEAKFDIQIEINILNTGVMAGY